MARATNRIMANYFGNIHCTPTSSTDKYSRLQQLRMEAGFKTVKAFAKASNIDINTYSRIEHGNQLASQLQKDKIAHTLKLEVEEAFPVHIHKVTIKTTYVPVDELEKELFIKYGDRLYTKG